MSKILVNWLFTVQEDLCQWSEFGAWSSCSATCGQGVQLRHRSLLNDPKSQLSACKDENETETRTCSLEDCKGTNYYILFILN
jgi:hypothetical protein